MVKRFNGHPDGTSTEEPVRRLNEHFNPKAGDFVIRSEVERVLQCEPRSKRYETVVNAWKRQLYREHHLELSRQGRAMGTGFVVLTAQERSDVVAKTMQSTGRRLRKRLRMSNTIDTATMTADERDLLNLRRRALASAAAVVTQEARPLFQPPPAATADGVRTSGSPPSAPVPVMLPPAVGAR